MKDKKQKPRTYLYTEAQNKRAVRNAKRLQTLKQIINEAHQITRQIRKQAL